MFPRIFSLNNVSLLVSLVLLAGCGSSSSDSNINDVQSVQAVDGYIVGGQSMCDDEPSGATSQGGLFVCPGESILASVRGGMDVGFDDSRTDGGLPFIGEMVGPTELGFVTPLSTLAVGLSTQNGVFNPEIWDSSVQVLSDTFGEPDLDLSEDPTIELTLVRLNAMVHQVISSFATSTDDYVVVTMSFIDVIRASSSANQSLPLDGNIGITMNAINTQLMTDAPELVKSDAELNNDIQNLIAASAAFQQAQTPESVSSAVIDSEINRSAITIDRNNAVLGFYDYYSGNFTEVAVSSFENSNQFNGRYETYIDYFDYLLINHDALVIEENIDRKRISIALNIQATDEGDTRSLTVVSSDVYLSAEQGDSSSITIDVEAGGLFNANSTSSTGVVTDTTIELETTDTFTSREGEVSVNTRSIRRELVELGFEDIFEYPGNFEVTVVISGVTVNEYDNGEESLAQQFTVEAGNLAVTGSGFQGFISYRN